MIRFPPSPKGAVDGARHETGPSTTFDPIPLTIAAFHEKTAGNLPAVLFFALFAMVEGSSLNVVDGPISWQTGHVAASQGQNDPFSSVPGRSRAVTDMVPFQNYAGLRG